MKQVELLRLSSQTYFPTKEGVFWQLCLVVIVLGALEKKLSSHFVNYGR